MTLGTDDPLVGDRTAQAPANQGDTLTVLATTIARQAVTTLAMMTTDVVIAVVRIRMISAQVMALRLRSRELND
jgi:hypothetical protein